MDRRIAGLALIVACSGGKGDTGSTSPTGTTGAGTPAGTAPTTASCPAIVDFQASQGQLVLTGQVDVTLDGPAEVWAVCTLDGDPAEQILVESDGAATSHTLSVVGLVEEASYTCELRPACGGPESAASFAVQTGVVASHDGWTVTTDGTDMSGTWTLFNDENACGFNPLTRLFIVDPEGRLRWSYPIGTGYLIDIDAAYIGDGVVHMGGGWGLFEDSEPHRGLVRQVDLAGNVLLERDTPDFGLGFNHHSEVLPSGEHLNLTTSLDTDGTQDWKGVAIEVWDPTSESVSWSWSSQQLYDDGTFPAQSGSPWHANSVTFLDDGWGSAAWVSLYYGNQIWRIDRTTGGLTHQFGPGGDFSLTDAAGNPLGEEDFAWVSHDPDYTPDGRVLLYDNGVNRPGGEYSRVAEFQLDLDTNEAQLLWDWTEPGWFEPVIGDADTLAADRVLITRGHVWCFEFTPGHSALIELEPSTGREVWRLDYNTQSNGIFRSERYDGCEIFQNSKYCPAVADRIAELQSVAR